MSTIIELHLQDMTIKTERVKSFDIVAVTKIARKRRQDHNNQMKLLAKLSPAAQAKVKEWL